MPKTRKRPQAPKSRSNVALGAIQATGAGIHRKQGEYVRRPKHVKQGWSED